MPAIILAALVALAATGRSAAERVDCDLPEACLAWFDASPASHPAKLKALVDFMAAHERDEQRWKAAQGAIRHAAAAGASMVPDWQRRALDVDESSAVRIAALRGLEGLGPHGVAARERIAPLANDEDPEIRAAARAALAAFDAPDVTVPADATPPAEAHAVR